MNVLHLATKNVTISGDEVVIKEERETAKGGRRMRKLEQPIIMPNVK